MENLENKEWGNFKSDTMTLDLSFIGFSKPYLKPYNYTTILDDILPDEDKIEYPKFVTLTQEQKDKMLHITYPNKRYDIKPYKDMEYYKNLSLEDLFYINDDGLVRCEEWRDVFNDTEKYKISSLGRVKSFCSKVLGGKILVQHKNRGGYLTINLCNGIPYFFSVHRLVALAFIPNPENKSDVNHKKSIRTDNRYFMLEWNTVFENSQHGFKYGFHIGNFGTKNGMSKLTEKDILNIREMATYKTQMEISKIYSISQAHISKIINKKVWE